MCAFLSGIEAQNPAIDVDAVGIGARVNGTVRLQVASISGDRRSVQAHLATTPAWPGTITRRKDAFARATARHGPDPRGLVGDAGADRAEAGRHRDRSPEGDTQTKLWIAEPNMKTAFLAGALALALAATTAAADATVNLWSRADREDQSKDRQAPGV